MTYWSRTISYAVYRRNPFALLRIIDEVKRLLKPISGVIRIEVVNIRDSGGAGSNGKWDLQIRILFTDKDACDRYDTHPMHVQYVKFVLRGWQIEGTESPDPQAEFERYVLGRGRGKVIVRNSEISDHEVVWEEEEVTEGFTVVF